MACHHITPNSPPSSQLPPLYSLQVIYASTFAVYLRERKKDNTRNVIRFITDFEGQEEGNRLILQLISSFTIITSFT